MLDTSVLYRYQCEPGAQNMKDGLVLRITAQGERFASCVVVEGNAAYHKGEEVDCYKSRLHRRKNKPLNT